MRLHFIGTEHSDIYGRERLRRALDIERPDALGIESSQELFDYIRSAEYKNNKFKIFKKLKRYGASKDYLHLIQKKFFEFDNYELFIPQEYSKIHTIPLFPVDDPKHVEFVKKSFSEERDGITRESVKEQNSLCYSLPLQNPYENMQDAVASGPESETDLACVNLEFLNTSSDRETIAAGNIRTLLCSGSYENIVVVYGAGHTLRDKYKLTLLSKLEDLQPTRKLLCDY